MKILITTPGGIIGRTIIPELLAPEFSVRVITRNPNRLPSDIREQVEIVRGSIDDARALREALEGMDAMFWCVPRPPIEGTNIRGYYERFARAATEAIRAVGVPRVVGISPGPASVRHAVEQILNRSGAAIRHLRCAPHALNPRLPIPASAAQDIADVALRLLVRTDWSGVESVSLCGLEDPERHQIFETLLT
jgi:uncharacterized protein YbjT (DUF2867 family)